MRCTGAGGECITVQEKGFSPTSWPASLFENVKRYNHRDPWGPGACDRGTQWSGQHHCFCCCCSWIVSILRNDRPKLGTEVNATVRPSICLQICLSCGEESFGWAFSVQSVSVFLGFGWRGQYGVRTSTPKNHGTYGVEEVSFLHVRVGGLWTGDYQGYTEWSHRNLAISVRLCLLLCCIGLCAFRVSSLIYGLDGGIHYVMLSKLTACLSRLAGGGCSRNDDGRPTTPHNIRWITTTKRESIRGERESYRTITSHCPAWMRLNNGHYATTATQVVGYLIWLQSQAAAEMGYKKLAYNFPKFKTEF